MKKIILLCVGVLVSSLTFASRLDNSPKSTSGMAVLRQDENSFKLIYKSELESDVKVQILDGNNKVVFSETIKKSSGFVRPYNFGNLKEGEYTINLNNGSNSMTETFSYSRGNPEKLAQLIHLSDSKYLLTVAGHGEDLISVNIINGIGEIIHSENIPVFGDFAQVYDLGKLKGDFSFEIKDHIGATKILKR